ncbi:N-acetyltransferase [Kitasatospora herbaricolor]|uniref:N-acetyltransferase n=1 Tax=Kitasatospora herbaricolor TaxID=68217 RepID=UPI0036D8F4B3
MTEFIRLPYTIYHGDPNWTPPLERELRSFLDPRRGPFFEFGTAKLFLAYQAGKAVGRIAAVIDPRFNARQEASTGFFGFFESIDDTAVAGALLRAASEFLARHGLRSVMGPMSFSANYDCGLLVDAFDTGPGVMMPHNPPYYPALLQECGFSAEKDLWSWEVPVTDSVVPEAIAVPQRMSRLAESARARAGVVIRQMDLGRFDAELARVRELYNHAWQGNWGFVPMTDREFSFIGHQLKPMMRPELSLMAEVEGKPVAFAIAFVDPGPALRAAGGHLARRGVPTGLYHLLRAGRTAERVRIITLGAVGDRRTAGIAVALCIDLVRGAHRLGYREPLEASWILEDNHGLNRMIASVGGRRTRTHRIYRRDL